MNQTTAQRFAPRAATYVLAWIAAAVILAGCGASSSDDSDKNASSAESPTSAPGHPIGKPAPPEPWYPSTDPTKLAAHGVVMDIPHLWREQRPMHPTRTANYTIPGQGDADQAEFVVSVFPTGLGGSNHDNILRWRQQFLLPGEKPNGGSIPEATIEDDAPAEFPTTIVSIEGQMVRPGLNWYVPDQRMLAALIQAPEGLLVIRLTGPKGTVDANEARFRNLIETMRVPSE